MTDGFVLDASVYVSAISPAESRHATAAALLSEVPADVPFLVPAIFRLEVVAALARRREPAEVVDLVSVRLAGPKFLARPVDQDLLERACTVARVARLRAYDALMSYLT